MSRQRKVGLITGGGSGVGAATARLLANQGFDVLINYRRSAGLADAVVADCKAAGADAIAVQGDVADDDVCRSLVQQAVQRWGRVDALVNSAAATIFVPLSNLDGVNAADFHAIFGVNAIGPFQMARAAAPHMHSGAIVNVSSVAGQTGSGSSFPYVLSKAALNTLTLGLARTLAPHIRVNAVLPGLIEGRWMREGLGSDAGYERVKQQFADTAALGRVSTPEHIAKAIVWLLDPDCMMTGQLVVVDGGFTLGRPPAAAGAR